MAVHRSEHPFQALLNMNDVALLACLPLPPFSVPISILLSLFLFLSPSRMPFVSCPTHIFNSEKGLSFQYSVEVGREEERERAYIIKVVSLF